MAIQINTIPPGFKNFTEVYKIALQRIESSKILKGGFNYQYNGPDWIKSDIFQFTPKYVQDQLLKEYTESILGVSDGIIGYAKDDTFYPDTINILYCVKGVYYHSLLGIKHTAHEELDRLFPLLGKRMTPMQIAEFLDKNKTTHCINGNDVDSK